MNEIKKKIMEKQGLLDNRKFILVTSGFWALGDCIEHLEKYPDAEVIVAYKPEEEMVEKWDDKEEEAYYKQGDGIVEKIELDDLMEDRNDYKDWYFVWDGNHNYEEHQILKDEGFKVMDMGSKWCFDLENDREMGLKLGEELGLPSPEWKEFTSYAEGISFMEEREEDAWVFKPNSEDDKSLTYVPNSVEPMNANLEVRKFIEAVKINDFVLQKKIKGVEVNVEGWYVNGEVVATFANLECKKRSDDDKGCATGCAQDVSWLINNNCKLAQITIGKYAEILRQRNYTGFFDANCIISEDQAYFIEHCCRRGYNMANTELKLLGKTFFEVCADMIDGIFELTWKYGFSASVTMITDKGRDGLPIYVPESIKNNVWYCTVYKDDDEEFKMTDDVFELVIATGIGYTIKDAFLEAIENADKVNFANCDYRRDGNEENYPSSPFKRYEALEAMQMF